MSPDDLREDIELKIVLLLKDLLATGAITEERARQISGRVLDILEPGMSIETLYKTIPALDDGVPELAPIVLPYAREYEENITKQAQEQVSNLIRQGQYDAAAALGQKAIDKDVELVWGTGKPT